MSDHQLALIGFGNVGQAFVRLLIRKRGELRDRYGFGFQVTGIMTKRHGIALAPDGLDLEKALYLRENDEDLHALSETSTHEDADEFIHNCGADIVFENTPVDYDSGQPALDLIRSALEKGKHVITANKGPVVHGYVQLSELAKLNKVQFRFESTVMDGAPIFSMWREALPAANIISFRGILNSTSNLILTLMEAGKTFDEAVHRAQEIGVAESDPSGDVQGWDAAVKVAALVIVLMGKSIQLDQIHRKGIEDISPQDLSTAQAEGQRLKLICQAESQGSEVIASVSPQRILPNDPLYYVSGTSSGIVFKSDTLGDLTLIEADPGPDTTAYGLLADLINIIRSQDKLAVR